MYAQIWTTTTTSSIWLNTEEVNIFDDNGSVKETFNFPLTTPIVIEDPSDTETEDEEENDNEKEKDAKGEEEPEEKLKNVKKPNKKRKLLKKKK